MAIPKTMRWLLLATLSLLLPLTSCQLEDFLTSPKDAKDVAQGVWEAEEGILAEAGGKVESNGTAVIIPPGALPSDTLITVRVKSVEVTALANSVNRVYEFGPDGLQFRFPVLLELAYGDANLTNLDPNRLRAFWYNPEKNAWEPVGGTVDTLRQKVIVSVSHFSRYAVAYSH